MASEVLREVYELCCKAEADYLAKREEIRAQEQVHNENTEIRVLK